MYKVALVSPMPLKQFRREYGALLDDLTREQTELCERFESLRRRRHIIFYKRLRYKIKCQLERHREEWVEMLRKTLHENVPTRTIGGRVADDSWYRSHFLDADDATLLATIRMDRRTYLYLVDVVRGDLTLPSQDPQAPNETVSVEKRCAIGLYKMASGECFTQLGTRFGVHKLTAANSFYRFCTTIVSRLRRNVIRLPAEQEALKLAVRFEKNTGLPRVMGLIGMMHFPITKAPTNGYINSDGWASMILQAVVDHSGLIRFASSSHAGGTDGYTVLEESEVNNHFNHSELPTEFYIGDQAADDQAAVKPFLIGGREYPLLPHLITRYSAPESREELLFNKHLDAALGAFNVTMRRLMARWNVLRRGMDFDPLTVPRTIICCCILHNILERRSIPFDMQWITADRNDTQPTAKPPEQVVAHPDAEVIRDWAKRRLAIRLAKDEAKKPPYRTVQRTNHRK
ncbi:uncharacterized protein LOC126572785 [Anopheles aquasalis]|uniref:uncharacterized protein LOC126572785 n=1 Tax=Anopheles aquasalis TaxID=42839 RepID=UPI00215AC316|nr:uncharacterized protein LOC126572785 [Anopheles aquasalis]